MLIEWLLAKYTNLYMLNGFTNIETLLWSQQNLCILCRNLCLAVDVHINEETKQGDRTETSL